jgi:hypothetical protein
VTHLGLERNVAEDMQFLKLSIESHDRQIGELTDRLAAVGTRGKVDPSVKTIFGAQ